MTCNCTNKIMCEHDYDNILYVHNNKQYPTSINYNERLRLIKSIDFDNADNTNNNEIQSKNLLSMIANNFRSIINKYPTISHYVSIMHNNYDK